MLYQAKIGRKEMLSCLLCAEPKCTSACTKMDCGSLLRSIWFDNEGGALLKLPEASICLDCEASCEKACVEPNKVPVRQIMLRLYQERDCLDQQDLQQIRGDYPSLATDICGVKLENPFLLSSSVVASNYEMCARAFEMGWAGAAFKTVCFMDIHEASPRFSAIKGADGSMIGFKNIEQLSDHSLAENMDTFRKLKEKFPDKVIIASIMGRNDEEWAQLAKICEEAGADVLELNFSCPNMAEQGTGLDVGQHPDLVEKYTRAVCNTVNIPVLAKLTPNTGAMTEAAEAACQGGAKGLAAINTIKSVANVNIHTYVSAPAVHGQSAVGGYSGQAVKPIALRFIAELGHWNTKRQLHISGMGGIETWKDALEFIMLGADSIQITTAVMQYGYRIIDDLINGLQIYMKDKGFQHVSDMTGLGLESLGHPDFLERDTIVYPKIIRERCVGCGRCVLSCRDGGHQALVLDEKRGKPRLAAPKCVGCQLCVLVCPRNAIISSEKRRARK